MINGRSPRYIAISWRSSLMATERMPDHLPVGLERFALATSVFLYCLITSPAQEPLSASNVRISGQVLSLSGQATKLPRQSASAADPNILYRRDGVSCRFPL